MAAAGETLPRADHVCVREGERERVRAGGGARAGEGRVGAGRGGGERGAASGREGARAQLSGAEEACGARGPGLQPPPPLPALLRPPARLAVPLRAAPRV